MSGPRTHEEEQIQEPASGELTASERLIWTGQRLDPASPLYNMALSIEIPAAIDVPAFRRAFQRVVDETDALRTSFVDEGGRPRRIVRHDVAGAVDVLCQPETKHSDAMVSAALEARTRRIFALDGPLFDCALIERRPDRFVWYLNQHHLITDAWSVGVLHRRLSALYQEAAQGSTQGVATPVTTRFPQFGAYEEYQRALQCSERLASALAYWGAASASGSRSPSLYGDDGPGWPVMSETDRPGAITATGECCRVGAHRLARGDRDRDGPL